MKKFTLGVMTGAAALVIAVPLVAHISSAASSAAGSAGSTAFNRPVPTQACIQAMAALDKVRLDEFDAHAAAMNVLEKSRLQADYDALNTAGPISDDAQRQAALKTARQNERNALKNQTLPAESAAMQTVLQNVKTACGGMGMMGHGFGGMMMGGFKGHMMGGFGAKFGHHGNDNDADEPAQNQNPAAQ